MRLVCSLNAFYKSINKLWPKNWRPTNYATRRKAVEAQITAPYHLLIIHLPNKNHCQCLPWQLNIATKMMLMGTVLFDTFLMRDYCNQKRAFRTQLGGKFRSVLYPSPVHSPPSIALQIPGRCHVHAFVLFQRSVSEFSSLSLMPMVHGQDNISIGQVWPLRFFLLFFFLSEGEFGCHVLLLPTPEIDSFIIELEIKSISVRTTLFRCLCASFHLHSCLLWNPLCSA